MTRYLGNLTYNEVTIASGGTISDSVDLQGLALVQVISPSAFTGTVLEFHSSHDNVTFKKIHNNSDTALSLSITADRAYNINPADFAGVRYLKLQASSTQGADRVFGFVTREVF